jgi:hypothetical protein
MLTGSCHCGAVRWTYDAEPTAATACNCTACRRYGVLWIYGHADESVSVTGPTASYVRKDGGYLAFHFCPDCGCTVAWRAQRPNSEGRTRSAVNLRLVDDPDAVMAVPIKHFDGLDTFDEAPRDARTVRDMWF